MSIKSAEEKLLLLDGYFETLGKSSIGKDKSDLVLGLGNLALATTTAEGRILAIDGNFLSCIQRFLGENACNSLSLTGCKQLLVCLGSKLGCIPSKGLGTIWAAKISYRQNLIGEKGKNGN